MPPSSIDALLARRQGLLSSPSPIESYAQKGGLLQTLGDVVSYPQRKVFEAFTGRRGAIGRDVLYELGLADRRRTRGFDVAGFGTELLLDPLNLLGGIGTLTKAGRLAKSAELTKGLIQAERSTLQQARAAAKARRLEAFAAREQANELFRRGLPATDEYNQLQAAADVAARDVLTREANVLKLMKDLGGTRGELSRLGAAEGLAKTAGARARMPVAQQAILEAAIPFTDISLGRVRGARVFETLGYVGDRLIRVPMIGNTVKSLRALFDPRVFRARDKEILERSAAARPEFMLLEEAQTAKGLQSLEVKNMIAETKGEVFRRAKAAEPGLTEQQFLERFRNFRGALDARDRINQLKTRTTKHYNKLLDDVLSTQNAARVARNVALGEKQRAISGQRVRDMLKISEAGSFDPLFQRRLRRRAEIESARAEKIVEGFRKLRPSREDMKLFNMASAPLRSAATRRLNALDERLSKAEQFIREMPVGSEDFARQLQKENRELLIREMDAAARSPTNKLRLTAEAYIERVFTDEANRMIAKKGLREALLGRITTKTGSQIKRSDELIDLFTSEAEKFMHEKIPELKGNFFELDPVKSFPQRWLKGELSIAAARFFHSLADKHLTAHQSGKTIKLSEFLAAGPLHNFRGVALGAAPDTIERSLKEAGLGGMGIPKEIAEEALLVHKRITGPEEFNRFLETLDIVNAVWRFMVTVPNPGFSGRNILSDSFLSFLGGGAKLSQLPKAIMLTMIPKKLKNVPPGSPAFGKLHFGDPGWHKKMTGLNAYRGQSYKAALRDIGFGTANPTARELLEKYPKLQAGLERVEGLAQVAENFTRTWHFLSMKAKGLSDREAAASVRKWLLDYDELTDFERNVVKRAIFFYNWPRKVLPVLLKSYLENPARALAVTKASTMPFAPDEGPTPEKFRRSAAIPFGRDAQGQRRFILGSVSPFEELEKIDPGSPEGGAFGVGAAVARTVARNLIPPARIAAEVTFGKDLYTGGDILNEDRASAMVASIPGLSHILGVELETLPDGRTRLRGDPAGLYILRNLPTARIARTLGQFLSLASRFTGDSIPGLKQVGEAVREPEAKGADELLRFLIGARIESLDPSEEYLARRQALDREAVGLLRSGKVRQFRRFFGRHGKEGDPELQEFLARQEELDKQARERRKAR